MSDAAGAGSPTSGDDRESCDACGAPLEDLVCGYCGAYAAGDHDPGLERRALEALHRRLGALQGEAATRLLAHGFLPRDLEVLIEAGTRCAGLVDPDSADPYVAAGAVQRLDAIVARLRARPEHAGATRVAEELAGRVARHRAHDRNWQRVGCGVMLAVALGLLAALIYLARNLP